MEDESTIIVRPNARRHRYELLDGDKVIGKAHWLPSEHAHGLERIFYHTAVHEQYAGQGLASKLARFALEDTVAEGLKMVTVCPYFKGYVDKHPEYRQHTTPVRPEHLAAVAPATR